MRYEDLREVVEALEFVPPSKPASKPRFELLDPEFELERAKLLQFGADSGKPERGWMQQSDQELLASLKRHLNAWERGESYDNESKGHHLAAVANRCMMLFEKEMSHDENV